jgi:hypothetical protein
VPKAAELNYFKLPLLCKEGAGGGFKSTSPIKPICFGYKHSVLKKPKTCIECIEETIH